MNEEDVMDTPVSMDNPTIMQRMNAADSAALGGIDDILSGALEQPAAQPDRKSVV